MRALHFTRPVRATVVLGIHGYCQASRVLPSQNERLVKVFNRDEGAQATFEVIDLAFVIFFTLEIVFNFYAFYWEEFCADSWNLFDVVVIGLSWVSMNIESTSSNDDCSRKSWCNICWCKKRKVS